MSHLQQAGSLPLSVAAFDRKRNFTPGDYEDHETNVVRLTGRQSLPFGFVLNVNGFYRRLAKDFLTVGQTSVSRNPGNTESRGGTAQLSQESVPFGFSNTIVLGSEFTRNDFGNNLVGDFGGFIFTSNRATDEDILGLYIQDTFHLTSQIILTGGARYDHDQLKFQDFTDPTNNSSLSFNRLTPRAGLTYLASQATSLYFNYSQGFRVPTIDELFAQGAGFQTNFGLRAAKSDNYEIGAKNRLGGWGEVSLAVFHSNVHDEIFFTCRLCDFSFGDGLNRNIDKSRRRGIEATLKGRLNQYFDGIINYTYTQAEFRSQFNLSSTRTIQVGDSFSQVPKHRLSVTGNVHPAEGWTVSLIGLYVSTQFFQNDEENVQPRLPGYFLLNSRIAYERLVPGGRLSAFLMANNLLDQKYSTSGIIATNATTFQQERFIVPAAGIAIYGGLSYRFEGL